MSSKTDFAQRAVGLITAIAGLADELERLEKVFAAREYTITQTDLDAIGVTMADWNASLGVIQRFGSWVNGNAVPPTNNRTIVNKVRTDI